MRSRSLLNCHHKVFKPWHTVVHPFLNRHISAVLVPSDSSTALGPQRCYGTLILYLVSVASQPHHPQATHLFFRPILAEPKHFLMVTQPPRRAGAGERERERRRGESESGSQPQEEHITASFPPCPALFWSDSSPARPKGELLPRLCIARYPPPKAH